MLSGPSKHLPVGNNERIFMATCLFSNIIFAGSFQGSLTTSFSTDTYFKDINTLKELDESGLKIATSSGSLKNIFGTHNSGSAVVRRLAAKYQLLNSTKPIIERTAYERDICCVERLNDISVIIAVSLNHLVKVRTKWLQSPIFQKQYVNPDGSVLLHIIKQCPRSYYMAYIVKKGSPLLPTFSNYIRSMFEGGNIQQYVNSDI